MAELHVTTWDGYHTFHWRHNQKTHGRKGVSDVSVKGDAEANWKAARDVRDRMAVSQDIQQAHAFDGWTNYTGNNFKHMNGAARNPSTANDLDLKMVGDMDNYIALGGVRNADPITVHRGLKGKFSDQMKEAKPGSVFVEDGFLSTSAKRSTANQNTDRGGVIMEIRVPKGQKAAMGSDWESELVYPRGTNLKVVNYDSDRNVLVMDMLARE